MRVCANQAHGSAIRTWPVIPCRQRVLSITGIVHRRRGRPAEEPCVLCCELTYVVKRGELPALLRLQAEVRNINSGTAPTYREARKDINSLSVCQLGDGLGVESAPLTAHVSKALAFISRSISA